MSSEARPKIGVAALVYGPDKRLIIGRRKSPIGRGQSLACGPPPAHPLAKADRGGPTSSYIGQSLPPGYPRNKKKRTKSSQDLD